MVAEYLLALPAHLIVKETPSNPRTEFHLTIFKNHSRELRMCYQTYDNKEIVMPWSQEGPRDWILLYENIEDDTDFVEASQFVLHEILRLAEYIENPFTFTTTTP